MNTSVCIYIYIYLWIILYAHLKTNMTRLLETYTTYITICIYVVYHSMHKFLNIHTTSALKQSRFKTSTSNPLEFPQQLRPTFMASLGQLNMQSDPIPKPAATRLITNKEVMFGSVVGGMVAENSRFRWCIFPVGYGGWSQHSSS